MSEPTENEIDIESCDDKKTEPFDPFFGKLAPIICKNTDNNYINTDSPCFHEISILTELLGGQDKIGDLHITPELTWLKLIRAFLQFFFCYGLVVIAVLNASRIIIMDENTANLLFLMISFYLKYAFSTWDLFFKKTMIVESNKKVTREFLVFLKYKISNSKSQDYIEKILIRLREQLKDYRKEMSWCRVLSSIITWSPPLYHQCLEETNFVEDKIKYALDVVDNQSLTNQSLTNQSLTNQSLTNQS